MIGKYFNGVHLKWKDFFPPSALGDSIKWSYIISCLFISSNSLIFV